MALCSQSAMEFIQGVFCPTVAVTCSEDAERLCMKNKLSFAEMARPFCQLTTEAHIKDPSGTTHTVKNWKLRLLEMSAPHPPQHVINKLLNEVVLRTQPLKSDSTCYTPEFQAKASTPWFEAYRDCFIQLLKTSDHEFIRHFLACVFVVSSHHPDPMNAFATMTSKQLDQQQSSHNSHVKWFGTGVFKYYVLIHDVCEGVESKADAVYQSMKSVYGLQACHMLHINSINPSMPNPVPNLPDPWSQFIIPASTDTLDWDEADRSAELDEEDPENCAVIENFDPETVTDGIEDQQDRPRSGSILIGPLSFEDAEPEQDVLTNSVPQKTDASSNNHHEKQHLAGHYRYFSSRQFTSGIRTQSSQRTHGLYLSLSDQDRIKIFIHELAFRGLLPFIERLMRVLNDQIMARKGLHRSIFSATKKWFGGGKPAGLASGLVPGIVYTNDAPELSLRKLGDLAFLVQNYDLAYTCYHAAKRDFNSEHVWFYFAGALEMAAISVFMGGLQRPYPSHYMETAISTYLTACRQHMFAIRATLLSTEALKAKNIPLDAALQFMRMTGEESDLLCALMLEQSAHCFLHSSPAMIRKYALNMILAGHRYSKSAQRKHALRCYQQALSVYNGKSWMLAEDHINFTLGRQSFNLRQLDDAQQSFRHLLVYESQQSPQQQAAYLREFLFVFKQLMETRDKDKAKEDVLPNLPLPMLDSNATSTIRSYTSPSDGKDTEGRGEVLGLTSFEERFDSSLASRWKDLEEEVYESVNVTPIPPFFRTHVSRLCSRTNNSAKPPCVVKECVAVEVVFMNPLKIPLNLTNLKLLWTFTPSSGSDQVSNEFTSHEELVQTEVVGAFAISGGETKKARLTLRPQATGQLSITGLRYSLSSVAIGAPVDEDLGPGSEPNAAVSAVSMLGRLDLRVRGSRLNQTKIEKTSILYGEDNRLNLQVVPAMPRLQVRFQKFPQRLLCGELVRTTAEFTNLGECSMSRLHLATTTPEYISIGTPDHTLDSTSIYQTAPTIGEPVMRRLAPEFDVRRVSPVPIPGGSIPPGGSVKLPVWLGGCEDEGVQPKEFMFYYESTEQNPQMSYRILQHATTVHVMNSLQVRATARRSRHVTSAQNSSDQDKLVVVLDIENRVDSSDSNRLGELEVTQVSCVSRKWRLQPLSHNCKDGVLLVRPGETIMTQLSASKVADDSSSNSFAFSHVSFKDKNLIDSSATPATDFFFRSRAWKEICSGNNSRNTSLDIGLVVFWTSSYIDEHLQKKTLSGQSHVTISTLAESLAAVKPQPPPTEFTTPSVPSPLASIDSRELLVKYSIKHEAHISHDFTSSRLVSVPVDVILYNCSQSMIQLYVERLISPTPVAVSRLLTDDPVSVSLEVDSATVIPHKSFVFVGQTSRRLQLAPCSSSLLQFLAVISVPGVFDLNQFRVLAVDLSSELQDFDLSQFTEQKRSPPSLIVVENLHGACSRSTAHKDSLIELEAT
ncbi:trafficking protein particle complex subunit 8 isoform X2 [Nematostella vectensis]|uniref:trafficking protein particle complex subunit 8 isoform X2 n=1 Tax=Nematostella vectensis TaxID=45351 RepID=UPI0020772142|nr:trafficking protein particle complex subunit 8 isoform X2 [Nematostella vectensis]